MRRGMALMLGSLAAACAGGDQGASAGTDTTTASTGGSETDGASSSGPGSGSSGGGVDPLACNGHLELCQRPYDQVAFPGTHNSMAATEAGFSQFNANHHAPLAQQLEDGVRVLLLDVTYEGEETVLCHGPCSFGSIPHLDALAEIEAFLDAHPREVLTIIYEDSISEADMEADFVASGLVDRVYTHPEGGTWPTLEAMIEAGTPLVVTAQTGGPPPPWLHNVWDLAWDTPYSFASPDEFSCALNRGSMDNDLFLVNHWVNNELDLPSEDNAKLVNTFEVLFGRADQCRTEAGQTPNFIAIDFYEQGDLFAVVDALNGL